MTEPDDHKTPQDSTAGGSDELRWLWVRVGLRLGIGLLVVVATIWLILGATSTPWVNS